VWDYLNAVEDDVEIQVLFSTDRGADEVAPDLLSQTIWTDIEQSTTEV
jgi:hypothetical protein